MKIISSAALTFAILLTPTIASAQHPPIRSAHDQACRDEATSRVVSGPNPQQLSLYDLGRQHWEECMRQKRSRRATR